MNQEEAKIAADALLAQEHEKSARLIKVGASAASIAERLRTGLATLMGAYVGWRAATEFPGIDIPPGVAGIILGLVVAAVVPARKT